MEHFKPYIDRPALIERPEASLTENFSIGVLGGLRDTTIGLANRGVIAGNARIGLDTRLTEDEFNQSVYPSLGIEYHEDMTREEMDMIVEGQRFDNRMSDVVERSGVGGTIARFAGGLAGGMLDPVNLIPVGGVAFRGGRAAITLQNLSHGALINMATEGALTPFYMRDADIRQSEFTTQDAMTNILMAGALGGFFGAVGGFIGSHSQLRSERLLERQQAVANVLNLDENGNVRTELISMTRTPTEFIHYPGQFARREAVSAEQRFNRFDNMTDEQLLKAKGGANRNLEIIPDNETGGRLVIDADTGEILTQTRIRTSDRVSVDNETLAVRIEDSLKDISRTDAASRITRNGIIEDFQTARAKQTIDNGEQGFRPTDEPEGVLVQNDLTPQSLDVVDLNKVREQRLPNYYKDLFERAFRDRSSSRNSGDIMAKGLKVLTQDQFSWVVDNVANIAGLRTIAKTLGITTDGMTKREIGDMIMSTIHGVNLNKSRANTMTDIRQPEAEVSPINKEIEDVARKSETMRSKSTDLELYDYELGISDIKTIEDLEIKQAEYSKTMDLDELSSKSPEVRELVERASRLRNIKEKITAMKNAMSCIIGSK